MRIEMENRWQAVKQRLAQVSSGAIALMIAGALVFGMAGCSQGASTSASSAAEISSSASTESVAENDDGTVTVTDIDESRYKLDYSDRDKDAFYDESAAIKIDLSSADGSVTIGEAGVYILSGTLSDGQVLVNAAEDAKVQLVLDGADITNAEGAAIYVQQADKCFITLAEGSTNSVADGSSYAAAGDDDPDAAIYSMCDLTFQGSGSLNVKGNYNDAVKTKDDLVVTGGTYDIEAKSDGLVGKDSVKIADGKITVKASEGDGIKSSKDDDESKGFVSIDGGTITVDAGDKGIKAETYLRVEGGTLSVTSADDALHCDGCGRIDGGDVTVTAGDDGIHVEYVLEVNSGTVDIEKSYEGLEGQTITLNDGDVNIVASDDAINAASAGGGSDERGAKMSGDGGAHKMGGFEGQAPSDMQDQQGAMPSSNAQGQDRGQGRGGFGGGGGGGMMDADENCSLTINGGKLVVDSGGDGLDSNGSIVMNGGTVYVNGPTSNGDGALDCGTSITSNGGTLIAVGSSGMAESFSEGSQAFGQVSIDGGAGDELQVLDSSGAMIASFTPSKAYQNVVVTVDVHGEDGRLFSRVHRLD